MRQVQADERPAYDQLYQRWKSPIFAFLLRRTGDRGLAEEAHQETWLRVYRFRARFDPARAFRPWLYSLAANAGRDARRPQRDLLSIPADLAAPSDALELRDTLMKALFSLSPRDRRLILLESEGFAPREIAAMQRLRPGTVRVRLHRARQRLSAALGGPHD
jgi:RNA polymerase sigma factor (sigma-70 family)